MERRDFLTLAATSAAAASGLAPRPLHAEGSSAPAPLAPPADMEAYVARVDAGIARIGAWSPTADAPAFAGDRAAADALARSSLQALFVTGMLGDLPIPSQMDARMQDRVWRSMPLFDEAHDRMSAFIASRTDDDLARVHTALRARDVRGRLVETLVGEAGRSGVSDARRAQMRDMLEHVTWRLAHQPPALLVGEYVDKVERVAETDLESDARQRLLAARIGEETFWEIDRRSKRDRRISRGAKTMGLGVLVFAAGGGVVAAGAFPGVFAMTAGVVMVLIGLVMLLVGLGTSRDEPAPPAAAPGTPR